jgi:hypothetical protein
MAMATRIALGLDLDDDLAEAAVAGRLAEDDQGPQQRQARVDHSGELAREHGQVRELDPAGAGQLDLGLEAGALLGLDRDGGVAELAEPADDRLLALGLHRPGGHLALTVPDLVRVAGRHAGSLSRPPARRGG